MGSSATASSSTVLAAFRASSWRLVKADRWHSSFRYFFRSTVAIAAAAEGVEILAVCPAWVQVSSADGTVLFEKILDAGERYTVAPMETAAVFRTGNSGSIYFVVNGVPYGPAAPGANVVKNIALSAEAVTQDYAVADCSQDDGLSQVAALETDLNAFPLCP